MKRLMELAVKLYPAAWRKRYEAEFGALLEDVKPNGRTLLDIFKGAVAMQLRTLPTRNAMALTVIMGLVGLLIGLAVAMSAQKQYVSMSLIRATSEDANLREFSKHVSASARRILNRATLVDIAGRYGLYADELKRRPLEDVLQEMKQAISISAAVPVGNFKTKSSFPAVMIRFRYTDPKAAQKVVQDLTARFDGEVLDPAQVPKMPMYPRPRAFAVIGFGVGLLTAGLFVFVRWKLKAA